MTPKAPSPWPLNDEFYVDVEEHCEDGSWYGYAHSDEYPKGQEAKRAILLSKHTHLLAEAVAKAEREAKKDFGLQLAKRFLNILNSYGYGGTGPYKELLKEIKASELRKGATPENGGK